MELEKQSCGDGNGNLIGSPHNERCGQLLNIAMRLACSFALLQVVPAVADEEFHAIVRPNDRIEIVHTIPSGVITLNSGAHVNPGDTFSLPNGKIITLPKRLFDGMFIHIK